MTPTNCYGNPSWIFDIIDLWKRSSNSKFYSCVLSRKFAVLSMRVALIKEELRKRSLKRSKEAPHPRKKFYHNGCMKAFASQDSMWTHARRLPKHGKKSLKNMSKDAWNILWRPDFICCHIRCYCLVFTRRLSKSGALLIKDIGLSRFGASSIVQ